MTDETAKPTTEVDAPLTVTPIVAAKLSGFSLETIRAGMRRAVDPLPSVVVGKGTGKRVVRRVVVSELAPWVKREAARTATKV